MDRRRPHEESNFSTGFNPDQQTKKGSLARSKEDLDEKLAKEPQERESSLKKKMEGELANERQRQLEVAKAIEAE